MKSEIKGYKPNVKQILREREKTETRFLFHIFINFIKNDQSTHFSKQIHIIKTSKFIAQ